MPTPYRSPAGSESDLHDRCQAVEMILSDVDGVLTDGGVFFDNHGVELKQFHIRDGLGIKIWQRAGFQFGLLTGRVSQIVRVRAAELGVETVLQGSENKLAAGEQLFGQLDLAPEQVCYIGDDLPDLSLVQFVGLGVAVADAVGELREAADYVTSLPGGRGAVREVVQVLLESKHLWSELVTDYRL
jgi:YrbI family 3-deoxy-D-manno-octulosonate 8-phosphate phosphatase